jgi:predicted DNA-binding ribbon-helix-helix protein
MQKHAVTIRGHRTSISLEPEFWNAIKAIAAREQKSLAALIAEIDAARGPQGHPAQGRPIGLSSAIRVYILKTFKI